MNSAKVVEFTDQSAGVKPTGRRAGEWRRCEHCGCSTNARERICCARGTKADRDAWDRSALDT